MGKHRKKTGGGGGGGKDYNENVKGMGTAAASSSSGGAMDRDREETSSPAPDGPDNSVPIPPMEDVDGVTNVGEEVDGEMRVHQAGNLEIGEALGNGNVEPVAVANISGFNEVFSHVFGYLEKKDVLNCRLACKNWTRVVDSYLEIFPCYYPCRHDNLLNEKKLRTVWETQQGNKLCRDFPTAESIFDFQKRAQGHPTNPFVGRSITLRPSKSEAFLYWDEAKKMARDFGDHVWFLEISTSDLDMIGTGAQVYKNLQEILKLFPNLRYLKLSHKDDFKRVVESVEKKLKGVIGENPLPKLPNLETLVLPLGYEDVIRDAFLDSYGNQVGKLVAKFQKWEPQGATLSNLRDLSILNVPSFGSLSNDFFKLITASNLEKLDLNLQFSLDVNQLFKLLHQSFGSLKALRLYFNHAACCNNCEDDCSVCVCTSYCQWEPLSLYQKRGSVTLPMVLPSLESFVVETASPFMNFQYLKSLPKLKYFQFNCLSDWAEGKEDDDDVGAELCKLRRNEDTTQLWKMMPFLKQIRMDRRCNYERPIGIQSKNPWISRFNEVLPQLFCDFTKNDWLKLRQVCKSWRQDIQNFIENHPILRPFNMDSYHLIERSRHSDLHTELNFHCVGFSTAEDIENYRNFIVDNHSTDYPFIGRSIALAPYTDTKNPQFKGEAALNKFWKKANKFLHLFGKQVWYLSITHRRQDVNEDEIYFYRNLHRCLKNLPNLKSLRIDDNLKVERAQGKERNKLDKFIKENPLPNLEHFESLRILGETGLPPGIRDSFFNKYGGQLQRLEMLWSGWSSKFGDLPKLVQLSIRNITCNLMLPKVLCNLRAPCLLKLELRIETNVHENYLFKLLEPFGTVRNLGIFIGSKMLKSPLNGGFMFTDGGGGYLPNGATGYRLHCQDRLQLDMVEEPIVLPNVEHLSIRVCHAEQSFQFLKSFPGLRFLQMRICRNGEYDLMGEVEGDDIGRDLRICQQAEDQVALLESQIWERFPKLKDILILPGTKLSRNGWIYIDRQLNSEPVLGYYNIG